jgi:hypothetical protein
MKTIKIGEVSDINSPYRYLEVFLLDSATPFIDISVTDSEELCFKFYPQKKDLILTFEDMEHIISISKDFLPKAIADKDID